jgi:hypothetical protein
MRKANLMLNISGICLINVRIGGIHHISLEGRLKDARINERHTSLVMIPSRSSGIKEDDIFFSTAVGTI